MLFKEDKVARADAEAIRRGVGFYRWTHDLVEITGKDALEVLQKIYISDISKVAVGRSKYTASLDENGEVIDDVIVMHMADGLYWVSDLYGPRLLPWIEQHKGGADIHAKIITYDWDMYAVQGPDSLKAMNAMLDAPVDDLKRFGICERKLGDIPVYIHRSGFTGENGYEIYSAFDKSAEIHDLALKAVEAIGGRELQTLEVYVRSIPMEKGFALKQDFKHLSPYECGLGWAVAADKDFIECLNPGSLEVLTDCKVEAGLAAAADRYAESHEGGKTAPGYQFMRLGYFCLDNKDTKAGHPVFNRSVSLKDSFKK